MRAVHEAFAAAPRDRDRSGLFVADGHCNDAGYRKLAELMAEPVAAMLRNRWR